jgi:hypothetical protein
VWNPLSLLSEIVVDRHRPGTAEDERGKASKIEQVTLVARPDVTLINLIELNP